MISDIFLYFCCMRRFYNNIPPNGIYIMQYSKFFTADQWDGDKDTVVGVGVVDDNCRFVIPSSPDFTSWLPWGGMGIMINGIVTTDLIDKAIQDYQGNTNTDKICQINEDGAARFCRSTVSRNGKKGYLPALGEMMIVYKHLQEINTYMALVDGVPINNADNFWTSTQYSSQKAYIIRFTSDIRGPYDKDQHTAVKAFIQL